MSIPQIAYFSTVYVCGKFKDIEIPENYTIFNAVEKIRKTQQKFNLLTMSTWNDFECVQKIKKDGRYYSDFFDFTVMSPLIVLSYAAEKVVRSGLSLRDNLSLRSGLSSSVQVAQDNVRNLAAENRFYQNELAKLQPFINMMGEMVNELDQLNRTMDEDILVSEELERVLSQQVQEINNARKEIDLDDVKEVANQVAAYIQETVSDPAFIEQLEINDEMLSEIQEALKEATQRLKKNQKTYQEKLEVLTTLWNEYAALGIEQAVEVEILQRKIEQFQKK